MPPVMVASGTDPGAAAPSCTFGFVAPNPVRYIEIISPCVAGIEKIPGDVGARGTTTEFDFVAFTVTTIVAVDPVTANGTIALICDEVTEYTGAVVPFTVTETPPS